MTVYSVREGDLIKLNTGEEVLIETDSTEQINKYILEGLFEGLIMVENNLKLLEHVYIDNICFVKCLDKENEEKALIMSFNEGFNHSDAIRETMKAGACFSVDAFNALSL